MKQKFEELIDGTPPGYYHQKVKQNLAEIKRRLSKVAELMDELGPPSCLRRSITPSPRSASMNAAARR